MQNALFKNKDHCYSIKANQMTKDEYHAIYEGCLYCTYEKCGAKLSHVGTTKNTAYFRTTQKQNHINICPDKLNRESTKPKTSSTYNKEKLTYDKKHISEVLKQTLAKMNGALNTSTCKDNHNKNKKSPKTDPNKVKKEKKDSYVAGGKIGHNHQKRKPAIYKRNVSQFSKAKKGTYSLYGYLTKIEFIDNIYYLTIKDHINENFTIRISIGVEFNSKAFEQIPIIKKYIESLNNKKGIQFIAICCKYNKNKEIAGEIVEYKGMLLNEKYFDNFIDHCKESISIL